MSGAGWRWTVVFPLLVATVAGLGTLVVRQWSGLELQTIRRTQVLGAWHPDWDVYWRNLADDPITTEIADTATAQTRTRYQTLRLVLGDGDGQISYAGETRRGRWTGEEPQLDDEFAVTWDSEMPLVGRTLRFQRVQYRIQVIFVDGMSSVILPLAKD